MEFTNNAYGAREALEAGRDLVTKGIHILNALEPTMENSKAIKFAAIANVSIAQSLVELDKLTGDAGYSEN